jgi:hypothetical protein
MAHTGKIQLTVIFTATPDLVAEGDRIFKSHAAWMGKSHYRDGNKALLLYNIVKGPELANPLDPSSAPTGNTCFVLTEVYESRAGIDDHWQQGAQGWKDFPALAAWGSKCKPVTVHGAQIVHSLW